MATTKIWPVHDSLKRLVDYASNPEKTEYNDLRNALHYVRDGDKTEKFLFVSGINCEAAKVYQQMMSIKKHFGKLDGNVAYHGYQSFKPGEVTPDQCHSLGLQLAQELWGDRYQILVTTHLDKGHLHNHILINSVSFVDGKKFNDNMKTYYQMREVSDRLCREQGLSVIEKPRGKTPRSVYFAEKNGEHTKFNLMREAIDKALERSSTMSQFKQVLWTMGYEFNNDYRRKYPTIKVIGSKKAVRIYRLGEKYDLYSIEAKLEWNRWNAYPSPFKMYRQELYEKQMANRTLKILIKKRPERKIGGLKGLYYKYCYLLGYRPKGNPHRPLSPEMKAAWRRIDRTSQQVRLIANKQLADIPSVEAFIGDIENQMKDITAARQKIYNRLRRCNDPEKINELKAERDSCTEKLAELRKELKTAKGIIEDVPKIREELLKEAQMRTFERQVLGRDDRER